MFKFKYLNKNPFGKNIGDCAIRAISAGIHMDYKQVCKLLKVAYKEGRGLVRDSGIDLYQIRQVFNKYFDKVEDYIDDNERPDEFKDFVDPFKSDDEFYSLEDSLNLSQWMELYKGQGKFLISLSTNNSIEDGHIVYVDTNEMTVYDTWDCRTKGKVDCFMRIKKLYNNLSEGDNNRPLIKIAIYINQGKYGQEFLNKIMSGDKTIETRSLRTGKRIEKLMNKYGNVHGQGIAFINNGKIIGYGIVDDIKHYKSQDDFYSDTPYHLIQKSDKEYGYDEKKGKSGIVFLSKPKYLKEPIDVMDPKRQRQSGYIDMTDNEEDIVYTLIFDN